MHFGDRELGCVGMVSMLPDMAQVAAGMALAFKMRSEPRVAMTFFGEGSTANGQWHEAMNFAGIHRLPVVFVLENNQFAYSTPTELEFAVDPVRRAKSYGFPGVSVDGNDVEAVFEVARVAADRAREGDGPTLIECHTMRMHGHGAHDDMSYVPDELLEEWSRRDPIDLFSRRLVEEHGFSTDEVEGIRASVEARVDECAEIALASPMPDPSIASEGVFAESWEPLGDGQAPWSRWRRRRPTATAGPTSSTGGPPDGRDDLPAGDQRRPALRRCAATRSVFCLGEDIGAFGGAFKVTDGFIEEFGADRVLDTPLAENMIIGASIGSAIEGMKPVAEMQFSDFIACGFDQLVNVAGKLHYRQGVSVPMVVRLPSGGGFSGGPFHSQNPEAWFMQAPGLKVVAPATAADAKGLLVSAIRDPNPVCFLEHKGLYRHVKGEVPEGEHSIPLGEARIAREGGELTRDRLRLVGPAGAAGGRGARRGHRGSRPAQPQPARPRRDPGERREDRKGADRP